MKATLLFLSAALVATAAPAQLMTNDPGTIRAMESIQRTNDEISRSDRLNGMAAEPTNGMTRGARQRADRLARQKAKRDAAAAAAAATPPK